MADLTYQVELTARLLERLESIEALLTQADAAFAYDDLPAGLRTTVIPNLARFPRMGKRYLAHPPQSTEALAQFALLPPGTADTLRVYLHDDYLILYSLAEPVVYLLSIRHHKQLSFDFARLWPT